MDFQSPPQPPRPLLLVDGSDSRMDILDNRFDLLQDLIHVFQMLRKHRHGVNKIRRIDRHVLPRPWAHFGHHAREAFQSMDRDAGLARHFVRPGQGASLGIAFLRSHLRLWQGNDFLLTHGRSFLPHWGVVNTTDCGGRLAMHGGTLPIHRAWDCDRE